MTFSWCSCRKSTFDRFDKFNLKYNAYGQNRLREIFLKQGNLIQGIIFMFTSLKIVSLYKKKSFSFYWFYVEITFMPRVRAIMPLKHFLFLPVTFVSFWLHFVVVHASTLYISSPICFFFAILTSLNKKLIFHLLYYDHWKHIFLHDDSFYNLWSAFAPFSMSFPYWGDKASVHWSWGTQIAGSSLASYYISFTQI